MAHVSELKKWIPPRKTESNEFKSRFDFNFGGGSMLNIKKKNKKIKKETEFSICSDKVVAAK